MANNSLKEIVPKTGLVFYELNLNPILCKPKLLPLKSVTLEKLEKMQRESQAKVRDLEAQLEKEEKILQSSSAGLTEGAGETKVHSTAQPDVWNAESDAANEQNDSDVDI